MGTSAGGAGIRVVEIRDGTVGPFECVEYVTDELVCLVEAERWEARVGGRDDKTSFDLRVTSIYRVEGNAWRLVHRHADSITTPHPDGPLRNTT